MSNIGKYFLVYADDNLFGRAWLEKFADMVCFFGHSRPEVGGYMHVYTGGRERPKCFI